MNELNGLVLIGGKSSRMGKNKGEIIYHNIAQQYYAYALLNSFCDKVYLSCKGAQVAALHPDFNYIIDRYEDIGPLNGLLSAFEQNKAVGWLVLACDMPYVDKVHIHYLLKQRAKDKIATAYINDNRIEPLFTIWEASSYPYLKEALKAKRYSLSRILKNQNVNVVSVQEKESILNINTPKEKDIIIEQLKNKKP